ncbi:ATP-binding protein [Orrella sp. JC864]|uniref:ATP-binding protein n=1 Tax=Orrella sp. JC864 TaxID=3120298 RepID=UPI003009EEA3
MNTLGVRLFATFIAVILVASLLGRVDQMYEYTRPETGVWDSTLKEIGGQIVASIPRALAELPEDAASENYTLPAGQELRPESLTFQAWDRQSGRLLMRSPGAPLEPLSTLSQEGFSDSRVAGQRWRIYTLSDADSLILVHVAKNREQLRAEYRELLDHKLRMTVLFVLLMTGAVWWVLRRALRPLDTLRHSILHRPALDFSPLPHHDLPKDLRPLIDAFNRLLARLDGAVQKEKRFVADAAHELRTPLAVLASQAQVARQADTPEKARAALDKLQEAVNRSSRLAEQLLDQARLDRLEEAALQEGVALDRVVNVLTREFETAARNKGLSVSLETQPCTVRGNVDALGVLVGNLLDNAIRHAPAGGMVRVRCARREDGGVELSVADNGPGVPPQEQEKIFDRFYRVPGSRERGSGIGLSLVARVAALHGATRRCGAGLQGRGLQVSVIFPGA